MTRMLEKFKRLGPLEFMGIGSNPLQPPTWIKEMEMIFELLDIIDLQKVACATFILRGEVAYWWNSTHRTLEEGPQLLTWAKFIGAFLDQYFPIDLRQKKECELLQLKQGSNPLSEYVQKFQELSIFAPHVMDIDECKARQFERGLSPHIQASIIILKLPTYKDVLEWDRMFSGCGTGPPPIEDRSHGKRPQAPSDARFTPSLKQQRSRDDQQASMVVCPKCGKSHRGQRLLGVNVCFRCGLYGHMARDCMNQGNQGGQQCQSSQFYQPR
ncbi:uncharacterized protein LOC122069552 [Macadamia integrifolia]|uniref:uncharacterized protein LOC122069552 n=1 Tax=Macadamia integrifolia TaxID=60698 RepID=UPI001C4ED8ED|nr:uncharacterized protein LOC122069552 [Macadamia integrifolia]